MILKGKLRLAYIAGIIDGEASIGITKRKVKSKKGYSYCLDVQLPNTNPWLPQWLKMNYGGTVCPRRKISPLSKLPQWKWAISGKRAADFLQLILPYLQLKYPQAELAISFERKRCEYFKTEDQTALLEAERILLHQMKSKYE
jgi:hypothetical protein